MKFPSSPIMSASLYFDGYADESDPSGENH